MPAYKDKQRGTWYAQFYYTDWTGQTKQKRKRGFKREKDAKEFERNFMEQQNKSCDILFSNLIENYLEDMGNRLKPTTMENKKYVINDKLLPYFGKLKINEIDTIRVRYWQNELISKGYSQTYLKTMNNQLSAIFNYAVSHYHLPSNPCRAAGSIGRSNAEEMKIWTQEQYEQFSAKENKSAGKLAFDILFYTGMRSGELLALTPKDILPDMRININKNFAVVEGKYLLLTPKTTKAKRKLDIPEFLYNDIKAYINKLYKPDPEERIFYFTHDYLRAEMKRVSALAGLDPIRVHDVRHSHASMLINMGFDILEIAERLGHESTKTTWDTYAHLYPDTGKKLATKLNEFRPK